MNPRRYEITDFEWSIIAPLLPNKPRGVPRADDRKVLNGIYWRLRTGSPWADIPEHYGLHTTCYNRFVRWRKIGVSGRDLMQRRPGVKGAAQETAGTAAGDPLCSPMHGALAGRSDHQDPRRRRCQRQPDRAQALRGAGA